MNYNANMRRAIIRVVVVAVVATCFACPVLQMFDRWDHGEAKGKDTESTTMMVAISVGLAIAEAASVFKTPVIHARGIDSVYSSCDWRAPGFANLPIPVNQPPPVLRI